jgi:hypothetical protein
LQQEGAVFQPVVGTTPVGSTQTDLGDITVLTDWTHWLSSPVRMRISMAARNIILS